MDKSDELVQMARAHLALKYRPLPDGWEPFHVDTPLGDKGYVICMGRFDKGVLQAPEIRGEGATIKDAVRESVRQVRDVVSR